MTGGNLTGDVICSCGNHLRWGGVLMGENEVNIHVDSCVVCQNKVQDLTLDAIKIMMDGEMNRLRKEE